MIEEILTIEEEPTKGTKEEKTFNRFPISKELTDQEREEVTKLFEKEKDLFIEGLEELIQTSITYHTIDTGDTKPIK